MENTPSAVCTCHVSANFGALSDSSEWDNSRRAMASAPGLVNSAVLSACSEAAISTPQNRTALIAWSGENRRNRGGTALYPSLTRRVHHELQIERFFAHP